MRLLESSAMLNEQAFLVVRGPALVLQFDATTAVPPGWRGVVDRSGTLLLERE